MAEKQPKLNKVSRAFGPKKSSYDSLSSDEKRTVSNCYNNRYKSHTCCYCRFREICDKK